MTEAEALNWLTASLSVSRETVEKLSAFKEMVIAETAHQNLIGAGSIQHFWARHIVDSAQLLLHSGEAAPDGLWLDLGTGAGFPGMIIALLRPGPIMFVESRRKRIDFLCSAVEQLGLTNARVAGARLEMMEIVPAAVISARAFAPLPKLLEVAHRFSGKETIWVLPKGRTAHEELETVRRSWQGVFHVKQSVTDPDAAIIVATGVQPAQAARKPSEKRVRRLDRKQARK